MSNYSHIIWCKIKKKIDLEKENHTPTVTYIRCDVKFIHRDIDIDKSNIVLDKQPSVVLNCSNYVTDVVE